MKCVLSSIVLNIILTCFVNGYIQNDGCITPAGVFGTCVHINRCKKLETLITSSRADRELLKSYHCGYEKEVPKVCCVHITPDTTISSTTTSTTTNTPTLFQSCHTVESKQGTCVKIERCPELARRIFNSHVNLKDLEYLHRSRCNLASKEGVCCENPSIYNNSKVTLNNFFRPITSILNTKLCGEDTSSGNKIIHGEPTFIDQYPWLAILEYNSSRASYRCGGTLISNRYVLTAAHCVFTNQNRYRGAVSVRLGDYNIKNDGPDCVTSEGGGEDCTNGTITFDIDEIIVHREYNKNVNIVHANDIALLKLNDTVKFNDFIRPICLPTSDITVIEPNNLIFSIAGWGAINESVSGSDVKLHTEVPYVDLMSCQRLYSRHNVTTVWNKQICAGGVMNRDSCKGDSGGPLMYLRGHKYELTGIISYGSKHCGSKGKPGIYTKVYKYIPWIRENVNQ